MIKGPIGPLIISNVTRFEKIPGVATSMVALRPVRATHLAGQAN